jgi:hypothetical protein
MKLLNAADLDRKFGIRGLTNDGAKPLKGLSLHLPTINMRAIASRSKKDAGKSSHPTAYPCTKSESLQFELWTQEP